MELVALAGSLLLRAEPMKKKKKIDPAILRLREDRKRRKIEKEIKRLEKVGRKLKPIDELEVPPKLLHDRLRQRVTTRPISDEELDYRAVLLKEWSRFKCKEHRAETETLEHMVAAQAKALDQLRIVSKELYQEALKPDLLMVNSYKAVGPVCTPPLTNYHSLDGDFKDVTRKWE